MRDRLMAKKKREFVARKAEQATGSSKPERLHQITAADAAGILMDQRKELSSLPH
ncbi:hypothetical protein D3C71_2162990 [compost metagenome]